MITASDIESIRTSSSDYAETERLKAKFAKLASQRQPMYLTAGDFDEILRWKLRGQYGRGRARRAANTDHIIREVTRLALSICHADKEYELELKLGTLCALRGLAVPVASAVLALVFPDQYAVIDFRGWRQVFGEERSMFSISNYKKYMAQLRPLADQLGWPVQEVDLAIWELDRRQSQGAQVQSQNSNRRQAEGSLTPFDDDAREDQPASASIPQHLLNQACSAVSQAHGEIPFKLRGIKIDRELIIATMEVLNAEPTKTLPHNARQKSVESTPDGLDRRIKLRLGSDTRRANIITDVLEEAGIAENVKVTNWGTGNPVNGTRLLDEWTW